MKKHFAIVFILILAVLSQGCRHRPERLAPYGWPLIEPKFDSLTRVAESYMYTNIPLDSVEQVTRQMESIARNSKNNKEMLARARYWNAYRLYMKFDYEAADYELAAADSLTSDSYTKKRIRSLELTFDNFKSYDTFCELLNDLEYYGSINDLPQQGEMANVISASLMYTEVPELGLYYLNMADSLLKESGNKGRADNLRINKASLLCNAGRLDEADEVFQQLFSDSAVINNKPLLELLYRNHSYFFDDIASLFNAYSIRLNIDNGSIQSQTLATLYETLIGDYYLDKGMIDSASVYIAKRTIDIDSISDYDLRSTVYNVYTDYYDAVGKKDLAEESREKYNEIVKAVKENQQPENKIYTDFMNAKRQIQAEAEETESSLTRRIWIIAGAAVFVVLAVMLIVRRRNRRYEVKYRETKHRADSREREMMGISLSRQHSEQVLDYVDDEISRLSKQEIVHGHDISQLDRTLRLHKFDRKTIRSFEETFANIHPDFEAKLRAVAPDLTDTQIRLCSYIILGMNNLEIAAMLNIKASSLRQARLRLRQKFGLSKDDSIADFLREITPPNCKYLKYKDISMGAHGPRVRPAS